jgi:hypothetical protein
LSIIGTIDVIPTPEVLNIKVNQGAKALSLYLKFIIWTLMTAASRREMVIFMFASVCGSVCSRFLRSRFFEALAQLVRTFATLALAQGRGRTSTANVRNVRTKERNTSKDSGVYYIPVFRISQAYTLNNLIAFDYIVSLLNENNITSSISINLGKIVLTIQGKNNISIRLSVPFAPFASFMN